jgi:hypothetical protein
MYVKSALFILASALLVGCTIVSGSAVLIGKKRDPIDPSSVQIYVRPPAAYEEIAIVSAKAGHDFRSEQGIMDSAIKRLKEEAAKVGANGVILEGIQNRGDRSLVTSIGTATAYGPSGAATVSGTSIGVVSGNRSGQVRGTAIFVKDEAR